MAFLRNHIASGDVIFNVGANVGVLAVQLARWSGLTGKVVAFEPNPYAVRLLTKNIQLNGLESQVEVVRVAVGDSAGVVGFHVLGANGMGRATKANPLLPGTETIQVQTTTLDLFARGRQLIPDWVIMDIEGWEVAALRGARELLRATSKPVGIVAEFHPNAWAWSGDSRAQMEQILSDLGRRPVALGQQEDPLEEYGQVYLERSPDTRG